MIKRLPTTDLYFLNACGHRVRSWARPAAPVRALGPNSFSIGDTRLVLRRDRVGVMRQALSAPGRLIYVIDDDIAGAAFSPELSEDYRRRLADLDRQFHAAAVARADTLVVSSDRLAEVLGAHPDVRRLDPYWGIRFSDRDHLADLERGSSLRLVHLGSGSHRSIAPLAATIAALLDRFPHVSFTHFGAQPLSAELDRHPRITRLQPMNWPRYRRWLHRQRFHIALYPLSDSPFDRARSINKLIEHAIVGAVGVYPVDWHPAATLGEGAAFAARDPASWYEAVGGLLQNPAGLAPRAAQTALNLRHLDDSSIQRAFWRKLLGIEF